MAERSRLWGQTFSEGVTNSRKETSRRRSISRHTQHRHEYNTIKTQGNHHCSVKACNAASRLSNSTKSPHRPRLPQARRRHIFSRVGGLQLSTCILLLVGGVSFFGWGGERPNVRPNAAPPLASQEDLEERVHTLGIVVPSVQRGSIFKDAIWNDVLSHMNTRLSWEDPDLSIQMYDAESLDSLQRSNLDGIMVFDVHDEAMAEHILAKTRKYTSFIAVNSSTSLQKENRIKGSMIIGGGIVETVLGFVNKDRKERVSASKVIEELYHRVSSDDFLYSLLVFFNVAVRPVASVVNSTKRSDAGLGELGCMLTKCPKEIFSCVTDPTCKTALDCLDSCAFNDQVCSYRCIASYESPQLQAFSLCILQKHNCLGLDASIPDKPSPVPMQSFRGQKMTHSLAQKLFTGWLENVDSSFDLPQRENYSWRVFAGKNAAYDKFPCQYQLFFPGKARNSFWYRPIFKVKTLDGKIVWRERMYRVKQQKTDIREDGAPVFRLSVLDNGVTSLEDWTIVDCDEDLTWCIFSYSGAAARAGLSYSGAILASRDGEWPTNADTLHRIEASLGANGIKMWELTNVDNSNCQDFSTTLFD